MSSVCLLCSIWRYRRLSFVSAAVENECCAQPFIVTNGHCYAHPFPKRSNRTIICMADSVPRGPRGTLHPTYSRSLGRTVPSPSALGGPCEAVVAFDAALLPPPAPGLAAFGAAGLCFLSGFGFGALFCVGANRKPPSLAWTTLATDAAGFVRITLPPVRAAVPLVGAAKSIFPALATRREASRAAATQRDHKPQGRGAPDQTRLGLPVPRNAIAYFACASARLGGSRIALRNVGTTTTVVC